MDQAIGLETSELKTVIATVAGEFYAQATPAALAGRLARLHQSAWDEVLGGRDAVDSFAELRRHAHRIFNPDQLIETCNARILWALTPVIAATLACGPGEDRVNLREIGAALSQLLAGALGPAERRIAA